MCKLFNYSPLMIASYKGHMDIVQVLLSQPNIEINLKSILNRKKFL